MWKLKGCPRCGGDMLIEKELLYDWYEKCIQCSFSRDLKELVGSINSSDLANREQIISQ